MRSLVITLLKIYRKLLENPVSASVCSRKGVGSPQGNGGRRLSNNSASQGLRFGLLGFRSSHSDNPGAYGSTRVSGFGCKEYGLRILAVRFMNVLLVLGLERLSTS